MSRLLQLNVTANWGSTGKIAEGIASAAKSHGWETAIAFGRYSNPSEHTLFDASDKIGTYLHYAKSRFMDGEGLGSEGATKRLIERIEKFNPDVIHLHNIHDHWLNFPLLFEYLAKLDCPIVWTFHDCWAFTGGCYHFENIGCSAWRECGCNVKCPQNHTKSRYNFQKKVECLSKIGSRLHIVGASQWIENLARHSFLSEIGATFSTIHNGVDLNIFKPLSKDKQPYILGVSNVWPVYKGLGDFKKLRQLLPEDIGIKLIGLNDKQIKSLPKGIEGQGRTNGVEELVEAYSNAMAFVNPSYNDTFPTVNLEALACGTPVITYRTGGSPEAIDAKTGIVVEQGNIKAMAQAVKDICDGKIALSPEACRRRSEIHFEQHNQFSRYIELYSSILAPSH